MIPNSIVILLPIN